MLIASLLLSFATVAPMTSGCGDVGTWTTTCQVSNDGHSVQIGGEGSGHGRASATGGSSREPVAPSPEPRDCGPLNRCEDFTVSLLPQATIADVASFAPSPTNIVSEPAGLGVVGLPTNFVVRAAEHTATGTLFDLPVTVRFTPQEVTIAPGDGSTISSGLGGRSWGDLGAPQFTPTDTSHSYTERGTYSASAVIHYRAEVDFGRGWRPVPGTLDIATGPHLVRVLEARSTLVERTCDEGPRGPGC
ncbi:hypothetical protein [Microbacterium thalli]|uniref:hypothetical protein n=1 Tax=Microbacterium thalli TaxID=3027921 RepID=UPI002365F2E6|nr:hypothetical protein [Microbacterium thalli]